jgi:UDP-GlcNAc:undecaprenyl-phosphate/decaprenyl-phosphate GlcNAc-1-phosphate transferase
MGSYLSVFVVAALATTLFMPLLVRVAHRIRALDDTRQPPVPRIGGLALALGLATALVLVGVVFAPTGLTLLARSTSIGPVTLGALGVLVLGLIDDIRPLGAKVKFAVQIGIAAGVYALGVRVRLLSLPFGPADLGPVIGAAVTILWLVGVTNAFNLLDGADGVAAGSAFFAASAIFIMSVTLGHSAIGLVTAALAGALLGFLPFNFPPARAFLGDSGSLVIGFLLAGLAVEGSTKGPTLVAIALPLVAFAVPVSDTTITLLRRLVRGQPLFQPDREHLHHRMASAGLSPRQVAGMVYLVSAVFALAAMLFVNPGVRSYALALGVIGLGIALTARYLRLPELNELARVARRGALQPRAIALNVGLRRGAERLAKAASLADLQDALAILFGRSEFDEVLLVVGPTRDRRGHSRAWRLRDGAFAEEWPARSPDEWEVLCPFEAGAWTGELHLRRRLGRRDLLLDLNLFLAVVQPALERAARRITPEQVLGDRATR